MATLARSLLRLLVRMKGRAWVIRKGFKIWRVLPRQQRRSTLKMAARHTPKLALGALRRGKR
jgi:hypothetical protein